MKGAQKETVENANTDGSVLQTAVDTKAKVCYDISRIKKESGTDKNMKWFVIAARWNDTRRIEIRVISEVEKNWYNDNLAQGAYFMSVVKELGFVEAPTKEDAQNIVFNKLRMETANDSKV